MSGPWTVSCFVKREGRWVRLWRVVDSLPIPLPGATCRCCAFSGGTMKPPVR